MKSRVVVVAIIEKDGKILMGRRKKDVGPYPNTWQIPGGGVDMENESLIEAIQREVREETGLEIKDFENISFGEEYEPDKNGEMTHYAFLVFRATAATEKVTAADDLAELKWFSKAELKNVSLARPSIKLFTQLGLL